MTIITAAQAKELYCDGEGQHGDIEGDWTLIGGALDHPHRQSRWHLHYWLIVRNGQGDVYGLDFGMGLTEYQAHDLPWLGSWLLDPAADRELELTRLHTHAVTSVEYRSTPPGNPMTEIEKYAIEMLHEGGEGIAEDDLNEAGALDDDSHQEACALSVAMTRAVRDNPEGFLAWFRQVSA